MATITVSPDRLQRIATKLYRRERGSLVRLAEDLGAGVKAVRRWAEPATLADGQPNPEHRSVPADVARWLLAAESVADLLDMSRQPRGHGIAERMRDLVKAAVSK